MLFLEDALISVDVFIGNNLDMFEIFLQAGLLQFDFLGPQIAFGDQDQRIFLR